MPPVSGSPRISTPTSWWWPVPAPARPPPWSAASWRWCARGPCLCVRSPLSPSPKRPPPSCASRSAKPSRLRPTPATNAWWRLGARSTTPPSAPCTPSPSAFCSSSTSTPACRPDSTCSTTPPMRRTSRHAGCGSPTLCSRTPRPSGRSCSGSPWGSATPIWPPWPGTCIPTGTGSKTGASTTWAGHGGVTPSGL